MTAMESPYLHECCRFRCDHSTNHSLEERRENGNYGGAGTTEKMNDQVTNDQSARLVLVAQQLGDDVQDVVDATLALSIVPR